MTALDTNTVTRLEKAAYESGFNQHEAGAEGWLAYRSTRAPVAIWLSVIDGRQVAAVSDVHLAAELGDGGEVVDVTLPEGGAVALAVDGFDRLHRLLKRVFRLSRALPDAPLKAFEEETKDLPRATERERTIIERIGQNHYRRALLDYWDGRCAITGVGIRRLLIASHIRPWRSCDTDAQRLDVFNGLLLAVHYDAVFDSGLMTVEDDGALVWSEGVDEETRAALGFSDGARVKGLRDEHRAYLAWHRAAVFQAEAPAGLVSSQEGVTDEEG